MPMKTLRVLFDAFINEVGPALSTLRDPRRDSANDPVLRARTTLQADSLPASASAGRPPPEIPSLQEMRP
jgi:hypothetical protein